MEAEELTMPDVSIILPTFNRAHLIRFAIESVTNQTYKNFELLIMDDGSTDGTELICSEFVKKDSRIKYYWHKNMGLPLTLNKGIKLSRGSFITFLGSDDLYKENHIELRMNEFSETPEIDLIHGGIEIIGNEYVPDKNDNSKLIRINDCVVGGTFFGRKKVFTELNGFRNIPYSEDSEFLERAEKIFNIKKVNFATYIYNRTDPDSITNNI